MKDRLIYPAQMEAFDEYLLREEKAVPPGKRLNGWGWWFRNIIRIMYYFFNCIHHIRFKVKYTDPKRTVTNKNADFCRFPANSLKIPYAFGSHES